MVFSGLGVTFHYVILSHNGTPSGFSFNFLRCIGEVSNTVMIHKFSVPIQNLRATK